MFMTYLCLITFIRSWLITYLLEMRFYKGLKNYLYLTPPPRITPLTFGKKRGVIPARLRPLRGLGIIDEIIN